MTEMKKSYGPVQDGVIQHLAVTGVAQFNPDEEGCPTRWGYKNVLGKKEPQKTWHTTGTEVDDQVNHFLGHGQNVLGKIARAGIHLLPEPGTDLLVQWGLNNKLRAKKTNGQWENFFPPQESLLWAAGIPFVGFPDVINAREQYLVPVDESDEQPQRVELKSEPGVVEVLDNKTTSKFKWAKPASKLFHTTQMNGYGLFILNVDPSVTAVRLSHNTYRTDDRLAPAAIKRSVLVSAQEIRERWTRVVEPIVEQMKSVAGMKRDVDMPYNLGACESFGGCPHKDYCHAHTKLNPLQRMKMSTLLKNRPAPGAPVVAVPNGAGGNTPWIQPQPPAPPSMAAPAAPQMAAVATQPIFAPPPPPAPAAPPVPQVVAAAPVAAPPAPAPLPPQQPQQPQPIAAGACVQNQSYWVNGVLTQYLCSTNGQQSFIPLVNGQMQGTPILVPYEAMVFPAFVATFVPPTAPVAAPPAPPAPAAPVMQVGPPVPQAVAAAPAAPVAEKKPVGRPRRAKMTPVDVAPPAAAPAPGAPISVAQAAAVVAAPVAGFTLFVNSVPKGSFMDLSDYVHEAVEQMCTQFNVADIRVAPDDSPIAYARWRGVLAGMVRAEPPEPGVYVAWTKGSEFTEVVVEALWPLAVSGSARAA